MSPPFEITPKAASLLAEIERLLGRHEGAMVGAVSPQLRRSRRVRTVHASVSIEGNTLTEAQVTAVLEGKRVIAPERDLREVRNAIACYEQLTEWNPWSIRQLLAAHKTMMAGLVERPGRWRNRGVGIATVDVQSQTNTITHIPPPNDRVPTLMRELLDWGKKCKDVPPLVVAAVIHYELEFIHPFEDGNGRMGRLWHSLILHRYHELLGQIPIESAIRDRQNDYYAVLARCDKAGKSTAFIDFSLEVTLSSLSGAVGQVGARMTGAERIARVREQLGSVRFGRKVYLRQFPGLSPASASRDLRDAVADGTLERSGEKATSSYRFCD